MKHGSLCTGYGGLDIAVQTIFGGEVSWTAEFDKHASKVVAAHYPNVPNLGDIKLIDWGSVEPVDIITAGYPCQPFSVAGARRGTDDPRHIFPYISDAIRCLRPRLVVLENVRGHLSKGFDVVLGTLANVGYDVRWVCIRASDVGAPHRRERIFMLAADAGSKPFRSEPISLSGGIHSVELGLDQEASPDADGGGIQPDQPIERRTEPTRTANTTPKQRSQIG